MAQCRNGPEALRRAEDKYGQPKDERQRRSKEHDVRCYNCNWVGHLARNCPAYREIGGQKDYAVFGHCVIQCP